MQEQSSYENIFSEIKDKVSLVDEMEKHSISLSRSGTSRLKCCCPFHNETVPSCLVYLEDEHETYHCFGCGAHGTVIDFIMEYDKLDWQQTFKYFKDNYNIVFDPLDIDRIAIGPNRKKENFPVFAKSLLISEDIRYFMNNSIDPENDFRNISFYMKNIDEALHLRDHASLEIFEKSMAKTLTSIRDNDELFQSAKRCKSCELCPLSNQGDEPAFGTGNTKADVFFINEYFSESNINFLKKSLEKNNISHNKIWFTHCCCCPNYADDRIKYNKLCSDHYLREQVDIIRPQRLIIFGWNTVNSLFKGFDFAKISSFVGKKLNKEIYGRNIEIVINYSCDHVKKTGGSKSPYYNEFMKTIVNNMEI